MFARRSTLAVLLALILFPLFADGQTGYMTFSSPKANRDNSISNDEAKYVFVSNRKDLVVETNNGLDKVAKSPVYRNDHYEYEVTLKLREGMEVTKSRIFTVRINKTEVSDIHKNRDLAGGYRYEVKVDVVQVPIAVKNVTPSNALHPNAGEACVVLQSKFELEISALSVAHDIILRKEKAGSGKNSYIIQLNPKDVDESSQLIVTTPDGNSNALYVDISELKPRDKQVLEIYYAMQGETSSHGDKGKDDSSKDGKTESGNSTGRTFNVTFLSPASVPAKVYVDGVEMGAEGTYELTAGRHEVRMAAEGYIDYPAVIQVPQTTNVTATMNKLTYDVTFICSEPGAKMYIDGSKTPVDVAGTYELEHGKHTIRVEKESFNTYETELYIISPREVSVQLMRNGGYVTQTENNSTKVQDRQTKELEKQISLDTRRSKYKDFSRWSLAVDLAMSVDGWRENGSFSLHPGITFTRIGPGGWGFYFSGYFGSDDRDGEIVWDNDYISGQQFILKRNSLMVPIGVVHRFGSSKSSLDFQWYAGLAPCYNRYEDIVYYYDAEVFGGTLYPRYRNGRKVEYNGFDMGVDFGLRAGLELGSKFGWLNISVGGMYYYLGGMYATVGLSLGNALLLAGGYGIWGLATDNF